MASGEFLREIHFRKLPCDLPDGWRYVRLGDLQKEGVISEIQDGNHGEKHPKASDYVQEGVPFLMAKDLIGGRIDFDNCSLISRRQADSLRVGFARSGDVLLTHKATMGRVAIVPDGWDRVVLTPQITYYRIGDRRRLNSSYLKYAFLSPVFQFQVDSFSDQSTRKYISISAQRDLRILLPLLAEQEWIALQLGSLDEKIDLNRRMNQTLEAMARAIFKSWFVDFDPVREGHSLFPGSLQGSPLGPVPKGWQVKKLEEICQVAIGGDWGEDQAFGGSVEVVCLRGVDLERLRVSGTAQPPRRWISSASLEKRCVSSKDVLIAASGAGPIGRPLWVSPAIMKHFDVPIIYSNFCKRLATHSSELAIYLDRVLYNLRESGEMFDYVVGTSVPNLDLAGLMRSCNVLVPPPSVLQSFARIMIPILERLYSLESRTLAALRDALLPKLLSGEIRVKQAEKIVGEVV